MGKRLSLMMCVVSAGIFMFPSHAFAAAAVAERTVTIKQVIGSVETHASNTAVWQQARIGMRLKAGWDIRTLLEASAELEHENGTRIKLGENSVVTIASLFTDVTAAATRTVLKIPIGQVWGNIKKLANTKSTYEIETPTAVASIRGTRLGISVEKGRTSVDVYEGEVLVLNKGSGKEVKVGNRTRAVVLEGAQGVETMNFETVGKKSPNGEKRPSDPFGADTNSPPPVDSSPKAPPDTGKKSDTVGYSGPGSTGLALTITSPQQQAVFAQTPLLVSGRTAPGALVTLGGRGVTVGSEGSFSEYIEMRPGTNTVEAIAVLGGESKSAAVTVEYQPPLFLNVANIIDNMEVVSAELRLDIEVTEGARFSVNGVTGATRIVLNPGKNQVSVAAWDRWNNRTEKVFIVNYTAARGFVLNVVSPANNATVAVPMIPVVGSTSTGARVTVNGNRIPVNESGFFSSQVPIPDEAKEYQIEIMATLNGEEKSDVRFITYAPPSRPLDLVVSSPAEAQVIRQAAIHITGKTSGGAGVKVNGRPSVVSASGVFSMDLQVGEKDIGTMNLEIIASREDQEVTRNIPVKIDITSPQINTSVPRLQVSGLSRQAVRSSQMPFQVFDQTPGDVITVTITNNGTSENLMIDPGGRDNIVMNEGKNELLITARDLAGNRALSQQASVYCLPGPLEIVLIDPSDNLIKIDDLPPWPQNASALSKLRFRVEIRDNISTVPEVIKYCRITSSTGQTVVLANERNYYYYGDMPVGRGPTVFTIQAEDWAGNIQQKRVETRIGN